MKYNLNKSIHESVFVSERNIFVCEIIYCSTAHTQRTVVRVWTKQKCGNGAIFTVTVNTESWFRGEHLSDIRSDLVRSDYDVCGIWTVCNRAVPTANRRVFILEYLRSFKRVLEYTRLKLEVHLFINNTKMSILCIIIIIIIFFYIYYYYYYKRQN